MSLKLEDGLAEINALADIDPSHVGIRLDSLNMYVGLFSNLQDCLLVAIREQFPQIKKRALQLAAAEVQLVVEDAAMLQQRMGQLLITEEERLING